MLDQLRLKMNRDKTSIANFNQGFRFLGVPFIRSLAIKTRYPEIPALNLPVSQSTPAQPNTTHTANVPSESPPPAPQAFSQKQAAFDEAGLNAGQFPFEADTALFSEIPDRDRVGPDFIENAHPDKSSGH